MDIRIYRILAIILGIIGILLVGYFWVTNQKDLLFVAMIPTILAMMSQRYYQKYK